MLAARVIGEKQEGWAKSAPPPSTARVNVPFKAGHGLSNSTDFNWLRLLPPTADHPRQESQISSAGAIRTRALTTGSPMLYQLSYGTGIRLSYELTSRINPINLPFS